MSNLQKLLDEKWPIIESMIPAQKKVQEGLRAVFTEGYNAAIQESARSYEVLTKLQEWDATYPYAKITNYKKAVHADKSLRKILSKIKSVLEEANK